MSSSSFTGRARDRSTKRSVLIVDRLAKVVISVGGIATILAVLGVAIFLIWVVVPLFLPASIDGIHDFELASDEPPLHLALDEYRLLAMTVLPSGEVDVVRLDDGSLLERRQAVALGTLRAASFRNESNSVVFGLDDGSIQLLELGFEAEIAGVDSLPADLRTQMADAEEGTTIADGTAVLQRIPGGQVRRQQLVVEPGERIFVAPGPVRALTHVSGGDGPVIAALIDVPADGAPADLATGGGTGAGGGGTAIVRAGEPADESGSEAGQAALAEAPTLAPGPHLFLIRGEESSNFLTGETSLVFEDPVALPYEPIGDGLPSFLGLGNAGRDLYVLWRDGSALRIDVAVPSSAQVVERGRLIEDGTLTTAGFVLGDNTLIWGNAAGHLDAGFQIRLSDYDGPTPAGLSVAPGATSRLVRTKSLARASSAPRVVSPSARTRLVLAGFDDGDVALYNVTNASQLARIRLGSDAPVERITMAPKEDALAAVSAGRLWVAELDPRDSEASFNALFRPAWYEGYAEPIHSWQSSSATDDFEPKHSLMPLIFGTIKATLYSMLFGAPLALLAAIFTSEFLDARSRAVIKPSIELMASLPSVVLGFLAALVFAPYVEQVVPAILACFVMVPIAFLLGAYAWQLLPGSLAIRMESRRFSFMMLTLPLGLLLAAWAGPLAERIAFAGDLEAWLAWDPSHDASRQAFADPTGGWLFLTLPLAALVMWLVVGRLLQPWVRDRASIWSRERFAAAEMVRFLAGVIVTVGLAWLMAVVLASLGLDLRGGFVDTYVQRNAMIVGFVMGFAVIPIIYTISEDALRAVPEHLRSASLGAGATRWQTATRIVVPTAMSGLFSALMIGLGRAVGETMIVLMAAGNTPVMSWNIFEGFRTLSANIAVELPEAVQGSTHYRTLFLAALVLFVMTFAVNTVAEIVRQRFRKRAFQL